MCIRDREYLSDISRRIDRARKEYDSISRSLSQARRKNSHLLDEAIQEQLKDLMLVNARFSTVFTDETEPTAHGAESCEFHISMNKGEALKPLSLTASGG